MVPHAAPPQNRRASPIAGIILLLIAGFVFWFYLVEPLGIDPLEERAFGFFMGFVILVASVTCFFGRHHSGFARLMFAGGFIWGMVRFVLMLRSQ